MNYAKLYKKLGNLLENMLSLPKKLQIDVEYYI